MHKPIGIFGGTFDPIHNGHLHVANTVFAIGKFAEIRFIPCKLPVHKFQPHASVSQRQKMIELAISNNKNFKLDNREVERADASYMIDTLKDLRKEFPDTPLVLILGMDSFLNLPSWKDWHLLIKFAHLLVVTRPKILLHWTDNLEHQFKKKLTNDISDLSTQLCGSLYIFIMDSLPISSTEIRQQFYSTKITSKRWLPAAVRDYIIAEQIYLGSNLTG